MLAFPASLMLPTQRRVCSLTREVHFDFLVFSMRTTCLHFTSLDHLCLCCTLCRRFGEVEVKQCPDQFHSLSHNKHYDKRSLCIAIREIPQAGFRFHSAAKRPCAVARVKLSNLELFHVQTNELCSAIEMYGHLLVPK